MRQKTIQSIIPQTVVTKTAFDTSRARRTVEKKNYNSHGKFYGQIVRPSSTAKWTQAQKLKYKLTRG